MKRWLQWGLVVGVGVCVGCSQSAPAKVAKRPAEKRSAQSRSAGSARTSGKSTPAEDSQTNHKRGKAAVAKDSPAEPLKGSHHAGSASDPTTTLVRRVPLDEQRSTSTTSVVVDTEQGQFTIELFADDAPVTVANFLEYVDRGHYDGTILHQVVAGYIVLGGGYTPELIPKPTRTPIRNEAHNGRLNRRGTVAMARLPHEIDSATCQFFINLTDNPALDHRDRSVDGYGYCVFGEITEGFEIVEQLAAAQVHDTHEFELIPVEPLVIRGIHRVSAEPDLPATVAARGKQERDTLR
jgi:cyclophilin family peptidyl-prolyl cis-trans isomerase